MAGTKRKSATAVHAWPRRPQISVNGGSDVRRPGPVDPGSVRVASLRDVQHGIPVTCDLQDGSLSNAIVDLPGGASRAAWGSSPCRGECVEQVDVALLGVFDLPVELQRGRADEPTAVFDLAETLR
jgi:hypothetical protein